MISNVIAGLINVPVPPTITADYLVVAGAGGSGCGQGNNRGGGGGGAGGFRTSTGLTLTGSFTITVGAGGTGGDAGANGGSGIVILRYADTKPALTSIGGGLTYTTTTTGGYRIYSFTAGTGTVTV